MKTNVRPSQAARGRNRPTPSTTVGGPAARGRGSGGRRWLVVGYGNTLRGDDAAGPMVAGAIACDPKPGVTVETPHQLTPELAAAVAPMDGVVFVDAAVVRGNPSGGAATIQELKSAVSGEASSGGAHQQDPRGILELAERLYGRRPRAWLVRIEACTFEIGAAPSGPCRQGMRQALSLIQDLIAQVGLEQEPRIEPRR